MATEWLFLSFFPQEDTAELTRLRDSLNPFLQSVTKALSFELENNELHKDVKVQRVRAIFDELVQNLPTGESNSTWHQKSIQALNTLHKEFDRLLNLKYVFRCNL